MLLFLVNFHDTQILRIYSIRLQTKIFFLFSTVHEQLCYDGQVRHYDPVESFLPTTNTPIVGGFLEVCYQGQWSSICLSGFSNTDATQLSQLACKTIYGSGGMLATTLIVAKLK